MDWSVSYTLPSTLHIYLLSLFIVLSVLFLLTFNSYFPCHFSLFLNQAPFFRCFDLCYLFFLSLLSFSLPFFLVAGFPQSTHPSYRSGATAICGRWVRFPSIGVWTAWTQQGCWLHLNSAREMRATWELWAPSARLVAPRSLQLFALGPYAPFTFIHAVGRKSYCSHPKAWITIRSPSGEVWAVRKPPNSQLVYT